MVSAPRTAEEARRRLDEGWGYPGGKWIPPGGGGGGGAAPPPTIPPAAISTITGIEPGALAATLYNKELPATLLGLAAIGSSFIIEGPDYGTVDGQPTASWVAFYAYNVNYEADNVEIRELRFRGKRAWVTGSAPLMSGLTVGGATVGTNQTVRFNTGSLTQAPDAWSTGRFGDRANAYRPGITATFENIILTQFGEPIVPHTTIVAADSTFGPPEDGIPWIDALPVIARYAGLEEDEFEGIGLTSAIPALFFAKGQSLIEWINERRTIRPYWSIRLKDKFYLVEKSNTVIDLTVDRSMVLKSGGEPFAFTIAGPAEMARKKNLTFVNRDRDYDLDTVSAMLETNPVPATTGFAEETIELTDVMTSDVAAAMVNYALYNEDLERDKGEMTGKRVLYPYEAGDQFKIATEFKDFYHRLDEVVRKPGCDADIKTMGMLTCAISSVAVLGSVVGAGRNGDGELGIGAAGGDELSFVALAGGFTDWDVLAAGGFHSAGIRGGRVYTWGDGGAGRLGHGNTTDQASPTQVGVATNWVKVACGGERTFLINALGELWACGDNSFGRLGDNTTTNRLSPVLIGTGFAWVVAGRNHAVAGKTDGTIRVWGENGDGQLGLGDLDDRDEPTQLGTDTDWVEAACGDAHTLLRKTTGRIYGCGDNGSGQIGDGTTDERTSPVQIGVLSDWIQLAAGFAFSLGLRGSGLAYSWGDGANGKTGHGDTNDRHAPTSLGSALWRVVRAAGGAQLGAHWFGIRHGTLDLYGCGRNDRGQLGLGDTANRLTPTLVDDTDNWVDAACGENFTIAIKE